MLEVAKALLASGVQQGEQVLVQHATARIGTQLVSLNPAYRLRRPT